MMRFVLDASVAVSWCFADEASEYSAAVLDGLVGAEAVVPSLWHLEVANILLVGERRKRCTEAEVVRFFELLDGLPLTTDDGPARKASGGVYRTARQYGLTAYDAAYLDLAMRLGLPLATLDRNLREAAKQAGVVMYAG